MVKNMTYNNNNKQDANQALLAQCKEMCPDAEFDMRVENNLVNKLEKHYINSRPHYTLVKEYSRPAAGKLIKTTDLRTIKTLVDTTFYLIQKVYTRDDIDFMKIYEFLFDRFRSIRQDMTILRFDDHNSTRILETILRFYIIADYKLCASKNYDEFMNYKHLSEVLHQIIASDNCDNKSLYLSIYLLLNLDNSHAVSKMFKQAKFFKEYHPFNECIQLSKLYMQRNYVQIFRLLKNLPVICQMAFHRRLPAVQTAMISEYNLGFSFKASKFPVEKFTELAFMNNKQSLNDYVNGDLINVDENDNIVFTRLNSKKKLAAKSVHRERSDYIDDALDREGESSLLLKSFEIIELEVKDLKIQ